MKFKLSKIEEFFYRYRTLLAVLLLLCIVATAVMYNLLNKIILHQLWIFLPLFIFEILYIVVNASLNAKLKKLVDISDKHLDINAFLEGVNYLIGIIRPKDIPSMSSFCMSRISSLINIGDYDRAEYELNCFKQTFNQKKLEGAINIMIYTCSAEIALYKNDVEKYKEQMLIAQTLLNSYAGPKLSLYRMKNLYNNAILFADAMLNYENIDEQQYVASCLATLQISPATGKQRKNEPATIEYISVYYKLFLFFKNRNNKEKAISYANLILNMANMQLADYREAKEFIDNENSSN